MLSDDAPSLSFSRLPEPLRSCWTAHTQALLEFFRARTGVELIERGGKAEDEAQRLFAAPFVVVSHGAETDPILNYGNAAALELWELTPRALLLDAVAPHRRSRTARSARACFGRNGAQGFRDRLHGCAHQLHRSTLPHQGGDGLERDRR